MLLPNKTARANWVQKELQFVKDNSLDGINIDFEDFILQNETTYRDGYTALVTETFKAFKEASPYYQVSRINSILEVINFKNIFFY